MPSVITMDEAAFAKACAELAGRVVPFAPNAIVGIASGGSFVAARMVDELDVTAHVDVAMSRPSTHLKRRAAAGRLLRLLPHWLSDRLRWLEVGLRERFISESNRLTASIDLLRDHPELKGLESAPRILIVDDTVDSGRTLLHVKRAVVASAPGAEVRTAVITSTWREPPVEADYCLYQRTLVRFYWSLDATASTDG